MLPEGLPAVERTVLDCLKRQHALYERDAKAKKGAAGERAKASAQTAAAAKAAKPAAAAARAEADAAAAAAGWRRARSSRLFQY